MLDPITAILVSLTLEEIYELRKVLAKDVQSEDDVRECLEKIIDPEAIWPEAIKWTALSQVRRMDSLKAFGVVATGRFFTHTTERGGSTPEVVIFILGVGAVIFLCILAMVVIWLAGCLGIQLGGAW